MVEHRWINVEPGVVALDGTPFSVHYRAGEKKAFALYHDGRFQEAHETLRFTQLCAEWKQAELLQMGIG